MAIFQSGEPRCSTFLLSQTWGLYGHMARSPEAARMLRWKNLHSSRSDDGHYGRRGAPEPGPRAFHRRFVEDATEVLVQVVLPTYIIQEMVFHPCLAW